MVRERTENLSQPDNVYMPRNTGLSKERKLHDNGVPILVVRVTPHQGNGNAVHRAKGDRLGRMKTWLSSEMLLALCHYFGLLESEVKGNFHASFGGRPLEKCSFLSNSPAVDVRRVTARKIVPRGDCEKVLRQYLQVELG